MKLILESTNSAMLMEKSALLRSRGIPVYLEEVPHIGAVPSHLYVVFDRQYEDAVGVLRDAGHPVSRPVYEDELEVIAAEVRQYKLSLGNSILESLLIAVFAVMFVSYVASLTFD